MSRSIRRITAAVLALLATVAATPAAPAPSDTPLAMVPASAPIVVHVRGVEGTKERIVALLKNALPDLAPLAEGQIDKALNGDFTEGRKPKGLAKNGPIFAVFTEIPKPSAEPKMAFIVAITKYEEFRDHALTEEERKSLKTEAGYESATLGSGETIFFVNKKDFAIVASAKEVAEAFTKKQKGIDERISKEQSAKLLASDAGIYLAMDMFNKEYADQIKLAKEGMHDRLKELAESVEKSQRSAFDMVQKLIDPAFQALADSGGILITAEFRPGGLALHLETELRPGTATAKALDGSKLSNFDELGKLSAGEMVYIGVEVNKATLSALSGVFIGISADPEGKEGKALQAALEAMANAKPGAQLNSYSLPMRGLQVSHYADPAKAVDAQLKMLEALGTGTAFGNGQLKEKPKVTPGARKYNDITFSSVEIVFDPEKMAEGAGAGAALSDDAKKQLTEALKKLLGDKQTSWIGTDGKVVLQVTAKDWPAAEKLLDGYFKGTDGAGKMAAFRDVRKELPGEANLVTLVDVVRYAGLILDVFKPIVESAMPLPIKLPETPAKVTPTYTGTAVTLRPDRASLDIFVSAPTVHELFKAYILPLMGGAAN